MSYSDYKPIKDVNDIAAGLEFPDPYRWLEANDSPAVQQWQKSQSQAASDYVKDWPYFDALQQDVNRYMVEQTGLPHFSGNSWFRIENNSVVMAHTPLDEGTVIFNLYENSDTNTPAFLSWMSPSPNGQLLAVGVCDDGSEHNTIRLIDINTRELLANPPKQILMDNWTGGISWLPDNSGFYFSAFEDDPATSQQRIFFYKLSDGTLTIQQIPLPESDTFSYAIITLSDTGRYHIVHQNDVEPRPVAIIDTEQQPAPTWKPFITTNKGAVIGQVLGDQCYALTTVGAPRGRIVRISMETQAPNDPTTWVELVPTSDAVMRSMKRVGEYFYIHEFIDTYSRVRIIDFDGTLIGEVPLPDKAALSEDYYPIQHLIPKGQPEEFLFSYSTLLQSYGVYRYKHGNTEIETLRAPTICIDHAVIEDHWATSADGTQVPYHSVRLADTDMSAPQPTLMYAYGAFNVPWVPGYPDAMAALIAAGGVYVHAHIRGGGELGVDWWHGGRMENKQNGYQDLYAIAEDLITKGHTTSQQLALTGRSNGGLMAGVAVTQRPELWRVVVPQVPLFDLIGALRDPYAQQVIKEEFANPENPEDICRMVKYSPYHLINKQTNYPAVYIVAGDTDPRCAAWHSRKFGAHMQAVSNGNNPILVHIWENAGHGQATTRTITVQQYSEWLAFIMNQLNLTPETTKVKEVK